MKKVGIFVDVQNVYYTTRQAFNKKMNYSALWEKLSSLGEVQCARAYAIESQDGKQRGFQQRLREIGFDVKLKPFIQRSDGSAKADWDVGIAVDVMEAAPNLDTVVLVSGDGDFDLLLKKVSDSYQTHTIVYGVHQLTADSLIATADEFFPVNERFLLD